MLRRGRVLRHCGVVLFVVGFVWGVALINFSLQEYGSASSREHVNEKLKKQILEMSQLYVRNLASEMADDIIDGPHLNKKSGYDLKRTLAVLLENTLSRLSILEKRIETALVNISQPQSRSLPDVPPLDVRNVPIQKPAVQGGLVERCKLNISDTKGFPQCHIKMTWMKANWKVDACYASYGVDGTVCSFWQYLSEIETYCPLLPGRQSKLVNATRPGSVADATLTYDLEPLLLQLKDAGERKNYAWIRGRLTQMWPTWTAAMRSLASKQDMLHRPRKMIILHLGLLSRKSGFKIVENANVGGPLGELVQWTDIIASLYILGHKLTITSEMDELAKLVSTFPSARSSCIDNSQLPIDLLYTDIIGLYQLKKSSPKGYGKFSCLLRIIDSFGTEPAFNHRAYAKRHNLKSSWGMHELNPQQFYTMFPHSPDNSFMGFVVESHDNSSESWPPRENMAVVYGKALYMWKGQTIYLQTLQKYMTIHATVFVDKDSKAPSLPPFVQNHGILDRVQILSLLRRAKLFIGLSFPYEGPAPLEAIAQGCVFINPRFSPPHSSTNTKFFKGKPTSRQVTSQHQYAEDFIGEPNVITVDVSKQSAVEAAIKKAIASIDAGKVRPYLPYEFTQEGMLQRVNFFVERQSFCGEAGSRPWIPADDVTSLLAPPGVSCKDACVQQKLLCEPSHFWRLNAVEQFASHAGVTCDRTLTDADIAVPSYEETSRTCRLQADRLLLSCVGASAGRRRLCPCRTYVAGQTALCPSCH